MTKRKTLGAELLHVTVSNLMGTREMFKKMGKPMSSIRKMDDAIDAINQVIKTLESK